MSISTTQYVTCRRRGKPSFEGACHQPTTHPSVHLLSPSPSNRQNHQSMSSPIPSPSPPRAPRTLVQGLVYLTTSIQASHLCLPRLHHVLAASSKLNGKKPEPFQRIGDRFTLKYERPILLDAGRRTIKAVALSRKVLSAAPSNIRTKYVEVVEHTSHGEALSESSFSDSGEEGAIPARTLRANRQDSSRCKLTKRGDGNPGHGGRRHHHRHRSSPDASERDSPGSSSDLSEVGRYTGRETWREAAHNPPTLSRMDDALAGGRLLPRHSASLGALASTRNEGAQKVIVPNTRFFLPNNQL